MESEIKDPRMIRRNMKPAILVRMLMMEVYAVRTPILPSCAVCLVVMYKGKRQLTALE
jgi:hypothetical protein